MSIDILDILEAPPPFVLTEALRAGAIILDVVEFRSEIVDTFVFASTIIDSVSFKSTIVDEVQVP